AVALDATGRIYVTGFTMDSDNFPTANAIQDHGGNATAGIEDAFISEIDPALGTLLFSSYLNGTNLDIGNGIAVDANGLIYVTGETRSANFPTAAAVPGAAGGGDSNAFVAKIALGDAAAPNEIEGDAFLDTNANGTWDVGETLLPNQTIYIDQNNNG